MVQACANLDRAIGQSVVNRVRKPPGHDTSKVTVRERTQFGHRSQQLEDSPQFRLKLGAEASAFRIVPPNDRFDVARRARRELN
jgi:hypothetical protein